MTITKQQKKYLQDTGYKLIPTKLKTLFDSYNSIIFIENEKQAYTINMSKNRLFSILTYFNEINYKCDIEYSLLEMK